MRRLAALIVQQCFMQYRHICFCCVIGQSSGRPISFSAHHKANKGPLLCPKRWSNSVLAARMMRMLCSANAGSAIKVHVKSWGPLCEQRNLWRRRTARHNRRAIGVRVEGVREAKRALYICAVRQCDSVAVCACVCVCSRIPGIPPSLERIYSRQSVVFGRHTATKPSSGAHHHHANWRVDLCAWVVTRAKPSLVCRTDTKEGKSHNKYGLI